MQPYRTQVMFGIAVHLSGTELVIRGNPIHLVCNVTSQSDPPRNVYWYKDGQLLRTDPNAGRIITKKMEASRLVSVLVIRRSTFLHAGQYVCRSSDNRLDHINVNVLNGKNTVLPDGLTAAAPPLRLAV